MSCSVLSKSEKLLLHLNELKEYYYIDLTDEKTNKVGRETNAGGIFLRLENSFCKFWLWLNLNERLFILTKQRCFIARVIAFCLRLKRKGFTVRQNAEFGLISCGLLVTIVPGRHRLTDLP